MLEKNIHPKFSKKFDENVLSQNETFNDQKGGTFVISNESC